MTRRRYGLLGAAALLAGAASGAAFAQEATRPWMDPPASHAPADETVTYPDAPVRNPGGKSPVGSASLEAAPSETSSPAPESTETLEAEAKSAKKGTAADSSSAAQGEGSALAEPVAAAGPQGAKAGAKAASGRNAPGSKVQVSEKAAERKAVATSAKASVSTKTASRNRQTRSRRSVVATGAIPRDSSLERRMVDVSPGYRRLRSVEEALDAGLMVTTVRTIQLPDGRRIEIESEPDPRTRLDVVVSPF